jgi:hypothetical protein
MPSLAQWITDTTHYATSYPTRSVVMHQTSPTTYEVFVQCYPARGQGDFDILEVVEEAQESEAREVAQILADSLTEGWFDVV